MTVDDRIKCAKICQYYGIKQEDILIEECAELIQAIIKRKRAKEKSMEELRGSIHHIIEEMADVTIMIEQMRYFFDVGSEYENTITRKLDRQLERIETEKAVQNGI